MKKVFNFRRLYQSVAEGEYSNAIVSFYSVPSLHGYVPDETTDSVQMQVAQVKYWRALSIDLWILVIKFTWVSRWIKVKNK